MMKKSHRTTIILLSVLFTVFIFLASFSKLEHYHSEITITLYSAAGFVFLLEAIYIFQVLRKLK